MIPYLARIFEISLNNATIPSVWKIPSVVPIYNGSDRSAISDCRHICLTSVICKQL